MCLLYVSPSLYESPDLQRRSSILCTLVAVTLRGCHVYLYVYAHVDVFVSSDLHSMFSVCCSVCCSECCSAWLE